MARWFWTSLALLLLATGCGQPEPRTPNIILISLDTLREDRVGPRDGAESLTPNLDAFAARASRFDHAWATAPWTLPSHASMLTGQYPFEHGAYTLDLGAVTDSTIKNNVVPVPEETLLLSERLSVAGYQTAAVVANHVFLREEFGFTQGFDHFDTEHRFFEGINAGVRRWLGQRDDRPFFLFLNYMDAHSPYNLTPRKGMTQIPGSESGDNLLKALYSRVLSGEKPVDLLSRLSSLYDLGVWNLDRGLGELFTMLEEKGLFDDAVIAIVSDHGEFLGEHDLIEHSKDVYEPVIRIPFLFKAPGQQEGTIEDTVASLVHVPYLIAQHTDALAVDEFPHAWPEQQGVLAENHFSRLSDLKSRWGHRFERYRRVWIEWPYKIIVSSDGDHGLYDLSRDPGEESDLREEQPERWEAMRARLEACLEESLASTEAMHERVRDAAIRDLTPEEIERLKALGYL